MILKKGFDYIMGPVRNIDKSYSMALKKMQMEIISSP